MDLFVTVFNGFHHLRKSSILDIAGVLELTLIRDIFISQGWILINLEPIFPSYRNGSTNSKDKEDDWLLCDGNKLISDRFKKQNLQNIIVGQEQ